MCEIENRICLSFKHLIIYLQNCNFFLLQFPRWSTAADWRLLIFETSSTGDMIMLQQTNVSSQHDNNVLDRRIMKTIGYHTNYISKVFKLNKNDKEDVRQDLAIAALQAGASHQSSMKANRTTYTKSAISNKSVDIMRELESAPRIICYEDDFDLGEFEWFYQRIERDVIKELSGEDRETKKKERRLQINCGSYIQEVAITFDTLSTELQEDIEIILNRLTPRHQRICQLVMKGKPVIFIAKEFGVHSKVVMKEIEEIRTLFEQEGFRK
jgi:DNA-directed RNA polymerase specialized sigma24 family protein